MRRDLTQKSEFEARHQAALAAVKLDVTNLQKRAKTYLDSFIKQYKAVKDADVLCDVQRQCVGAVGNLVAGSIDSIISSLYLLPADRHRLIELACEQWTDRILPKILNDQLFKGQVYEMNQQPGEFLAPMLQAQAHGLVPVFAFMSKGIILKFIEDEQFDLAKLTKDEQRLIKKCLGYYLKLVRQNERLVKDSSIRHYPFEQRAHWWRILYEIDPSYKELKWFEQDGRVYPFPEWWERSTGLSDRWARYVELDYNSDYKSFYLSQHEQLARDLQAYVDKSAFSRLDEFDYQQLMRCIKARLSQAVRASAAESQAPIFDKDLLQLRTIGQNCIICFADTFHDDSEFYQDADNHDGVDLLKRDLSYLTGLITKQGGIAWPAEYWSENISIAAVWQQVYHSLGFEAYEEFVLSNHPLVTRHLMWSNFELRWERQYPSDGGVLDDDAKKSLAQDFRAIVDAIISRLKQRQDHAEAILIDYRHILETYVGYYPDADITQLLENSDQYLQPDPLAKAWVTALCEADRADEFYKDTSIVSGLTPENYRTHSHDLKAMMAEGALIVLKAHDRKHLMLSTVQRPQLVGVLTTFMGTSFTKNLMNGVDIRQLKIDVSTYLTALKADNTQDSWLQQANARLLRMHGGFIYRLAHDAWVDQALSLSFYQQLSSQSKRLIAQLICDRLNLYYDDLERGYTVVSYQDHDRRAWLDIAFNFIKAYRFISDGDDQLAKRLKTIILKLNVGGSHTNKRPRVTRLSFLNANTESYGQRCQQWYGSEQFLGISIKNFTRLSGIKEVDDFADLGRHFKRVVNASLDAELVLLRDDAVNLEKLHEALGKIVTKERVNQWYVEAISEKMMMNALGVDMVSTWLLEDIIIDQFMTMTPFMIPNFIQNSPFYAASLINLLVSEELNSDSPICLVALLVLNQLGDCERHAVDSLLDAAKRFPGFEQYFSSLSLGSVSSRISYVIEAWDSLLREYDYQAERLKNVLLDFGVDVDLLGLSASFESLVLDLNSQVKQADYVSKLKKLVGVTTIDEEWASLAVRWGGASSAASGGVFSQTHAKTGKLDDSVDAARPGNQACCA